MAFDPELDELFGVTHSKQEINPSEMLRQELGQNLEAIAQTLNSRVRSAFALVRKQETGHSGAEARANSRESALPPVATTTPNKATRVPRQSFRAMPKVNGQLPKLSFRIKTVELDHPDAYIWDQSSANAITIRVNRNHSFFDQLYARIGEQSPELKSSIDTMLIAMVRAELATDGGQAKQTIQKYRRLFSNILAAYLGD